MNIPTLKGLLDFAGKVAIVTGSSSGLGEGIALRFAEAGAAVVVNYIANGEGEQKFFNFKSGVLDFKSNGECAQNVVDQIKTKGGNAIAVQADVSQRKEVEQMVAEAVNAFGRLDVIVNNAGLQPLVNLLDMTDEDWDMVINVNMRGTFLCTQIAAKQMIAQGDGGAIINIGSIEAENPAPMHSHYSASKAGVIMFACSAANELGSHGIRVNTVSPGLIWRAGIEEGWPEGVERYKKASPIGRLGMRDDIADACLFLASPAARWISGVNLRVDGGVMTNRIF